MSHVRLATYTVTNGTPAEVADKAKAGMLPIFREEPGFLRYAVFEVDPGTIMSVSEWQSPEDAASATQMAASWVADNLAGAVALTSNEVGDEALLENITGTSLFDEKA